MVSAEVSAKMFDSHFVTETSEDQTKAKPGRYMDELNTDEDDEVTQFVNVSVRNNEADRESIDGGKIFAILKAYFVGSVR